MPSTKLLRHFVRAASNLFPKSKGIDHHAVLRHPLITEKDMKKMEDENTMVFIVHSRATKPQIRRAFEKIHSVKVRNVNVQNDHR
jgi:large subunit ribosomal protein L23Ae